MLCLQKHNLPAHPKARPYCMDNNLQLDEKLGSSCSNLFKFCVKNFQVHFPSQFSFFVPFRVGESA
jgi:hypothetical protein